MSRKSRPDPKTNTLLEHGCLNRRQGSVRDSLFRGSEFFDPRDLVQVKYEMLRRVQVDGQSIRATAAAFGFSRQSFYLALEALVAEGMPGLLPKKRGPRGGHKMTEPIASFVERARSDDETLGGRGLAVKVKERFGVVLHPRTIERSLRRTAEKKRR